MSDINLLKRNNIYYFRCKIPQDIFPHIERKEIWKSLKTNNFKAAKVIALKLLYSTERLFLHLRSGMFTDTQMKHDATIFVGVSAPNSGTAWDFTIGCPTGSIAPTPTPTPTPGNYTCSSSSYVGKCPTLNICFDQSFSSGYYETSMGTFSFDPQSSSSITSAAQSTANACL